MFLSEGMSFAIFLLSIILVFRILSHLQPIHIRKTSLTKRIRRAIKDRNYVSLSFMARTEEAKNSPWVIDEFLKFEEVGDMFNLFLRKTEYNYTEILSTISKCAEEKMMDEFTHILNYYIRDNHADKKFVYIVTSMIMDSGWMEGYIVLKEYTKDGIISNNLLKNCLNYLPEVERQFMIDNYFPYLN